MLASFSVVSLELSLGEGASHLCPFTKFENVKLAIFPFIFFYFLFLAVYLNETATLPNILVYFKRVAVGSMYKIISPENSKCVSSITTLIVASFSCLKYMA